MKRRCRWAEGDPLLERYHDEEWGVAPSGDAGHFELLTLELFQSGLSWRTILHKRPAFREAFRGFDVARVASLTRDEVDRLVADARIVRHRGKIEATVDNARAALAIGRTGRSLAAFCAGLPTDPIAAARRLKAAGFRYLGPTTVQSYLEASGRVPPPHEPGCSLARGRRPS